MSQPSGISAFGSSLTETGALQLLGQETLSLTTDQWEGQGHQGACQQLDPNLFGSQVSLALTVNCWCWKQELCLLPLSTCHPEQAGGLLGAVGGCWGPAGPTRGAPAPQTCPPLAALPTPALQPIPAATGAHRQPDSPSHCSTASVLPRHQGPPPAGKFPCRPSIAVLGSGRGSEAMALSSLPKQGSTCLLAALSKWLCPMIILPWSTWFTPLAP